MAPNDAPQQQETQPVGFELEQNDLYGKYMLTTSLDILFILRSLVKRGCMATVYFNHGKSFFLTWIVAVGKDEKSLILDVGSDQTTNREALKADRLIVTASLDSVKIQFALNGVRDFTYENQPAFLASLPERVLRLQRREYFRLETSLTNPVRCQVPVTGKDGAATSLDLTLLDISGGGLSLMAPPNTTDYFQVGTIFSDCRLQIPEESVILVSLCIRSAFRVVSRGGQEYFRIGCEYMNLPGARLNMIQRYITRIERERKAREIGLD